MPIIEYTCENCGKSFEEIVLSRKDIKEELECPDCNTSTKKQDFPSTHGFNAQDLIRSRS